MALNNPTTKFTGIEFTPDANTKYNGLFVPQLTSQEIANIPVDATKVGGIVYNLQTQELQYLAPTLQWVNVTTDGGEPSFSNLTVTDTATINNASITSLTIPGGLFTVNALNVTTNAIIGNLYAKRPGASIFSTSVSSFVAAASTPVKIQATTSASYQNGFFTNQSINRINYAPITPVNLMSVVITGWYNFVFSRNDTITLVVAINGTQLPLTTSYTVTTGTFCTASISLTTNLVVTGGVGDYIELWIIAEAGGTFSAAGTMNLSVTQA